MPARSRSSVLNAPTSSLILPSSPLSRRRVLQGSAGLGAISALGGLTACGSGSGSASGEVTLGSNRGDEVPRKAEDAVIAAFEEQSGATISANVLDNETFQENFNSYLQGDPDDVFTWFAGFRARFFDDQGFTGDLTNVWETIGSGYSDAFKTASTNGEKQIFVPFYNYPWAVFYRTDVFDEKGYTVPTTLEEFEELCKQIQSDGLVPVALGDKDGWPAMGTFDILNMRINGYDFHIDLLAGNQKWDGPEVRDVFDTWAKLLPYHQENPNGRTWQEAAASLQTGEAAMYVLGLFVGEQFEEADRANLDFFTFPEIDSAIGSGDIDAPIDGYMMRANPQNEEGAKAWLEFVGSAAAQDIFIATNPNSIAAHKDADTSGYTPLQLKAQELISSATGIAQFLDRDTNPDFVSTIVIPTLQSFLDNPDDIDTVVSDLQTGKERIFTE